MFGMLKTYWQIVMETCICQSYISKEWNCIASCMKNCTISQGLKVILRIQMHAVTCTNTEQQAVCSPPIR